MDAPIAPSAMRHADDGPAYDLISLGLVLFTILLITVWVSHYFRMQVPDAKELDLIEARAPHNEDTGALTSAGHLQMAQWADFNLRSPLSNSVSIEFRDHLKLALELEVQERLRLGWLLEEPAREGFDRVTAAEQLRKDGPSRQYADAWYKRRAAWLDDCDTTRFDVRAHSGLATLLKDLSMSREARIEIDKILAVRDRDGLDFGSHYEFLSVLVEFGMQEEAAGGKVVSAKFRHQLKAALAAEDARRAPLLKLMRDGTPEQKLKAEEELAKQPPNGPVRIFATAWYEIRAKWLKRDNGAHYDDATRLDFVNLLRDLGLEEEAIREAANGPPPPGGKEPR